MLDIICKIKRKFEHNYIILLQTFFCKYNNINFSILLALKRILLPFTR